MTRMHTITVYFVATCGDTYDRFEVKAASHAAAMRKVWAELDRTMGMDRDADGNLTRKDCHIESETLIVVRD